MNIKVDVDKQAGVCGGVKRAIKMVENSLQDKDDIYASGELLHNRLEMERLMDCGLKLEQDVKKLKDSTLFIRTHGVGKNIIEEAQDNNNSIVDATCPKVSRSQNTIEQFYKDGYQVIIVGKLHHPEVQGLLGHCNGEAIVIMKDEDLEAIDYSKKSAIIAQTTVASSLFQHFIDILNTKIDDLKVANTICSFVENRQRELVSFAEKYSVVVFIGGSNSSNTKVMFQHIKMHNPRAHLIENVTQIDFSWFKDGDEIGVSGSASTPMWQIEEVASVLRDHFK